MSQTLINLLVGVLVLGLVAFRMSRERKFGMNSLWVLPAILGVLMIVDVTMTGVASPLNIVYMLLALAAGVAFGWYQGVHSTVRIDKSIRAAFVKASPIGMALFVGAVAFRFGARYMSDSFSSSAPTTRSDFGSPHLAPMVELVSALTLIFAVGLLTGLRVYVKRKYDEATG
ncbi:MAG TPA: hypothetical protein VJO33_09205 [Gemmatimonadaceae bacterium]|nr:hypothetical protein [Gemmatimonadaceae bacterium]